MTKGIERILEQHFSRAKAALARLARALLFRDVETLRGFPILLLGKS